MNIKLFSLALTFLQKRYLGKTKVTYMNLLVPITVTLMPQLHVIDLSLFFNIYRFRKKENFKIIFTLFIRIDRLPFDSSL